MSRGKNGITLLVVSTLALFLAFEFVRAAPLPMLYKRNPDEKYEAGEIAPPTAPAIAETLFPSPHLF